MAATDAPTAPTDTVRPGDARVDPAEFFYISEKIYETPVSDQSSVKDSMPYQWTTPPRQSRQEMHLWPHNSLSAEGFAAMILGFFLFASVPLYAVIGTAVLWGVLPFMLAATAALYHALRRNQRDRQILEVLTVTAERTHLSRTNPKGDTQVWETNTYWVKVSMHQTGGPVPYYVTLKGNGREVEIGAFLSEDERKALYGDLTDAVRRAAHP